MAWLFACFGYTTKKRKRPKKASKFGSKSRRIQRYQPLLESDVPQDLGVSEPLSSSDLELRDETKDQKKAKIRKKVRFNLDVITYEPIPNDDVSSNSQEDEGDRNWNDSEEEDEQDKAKVCRLVYTPLGQPTNSSSSTHRYNNCYDDDYDDVDDNEGEDEDEDAECGISDLDDDDGEYCDGEFYGWIDPQKIYHEEIPEEHQVSCPLTSSGDQNLGSSTGYTRYRSHYIISVLNPVENTSQWKALKYKKVLSHA